MHSEEAEPRYVISIAAQMVGVKVHTLRYYERIGVVRPQRSEGNIRLYSKAEIELLQKVKTLMEDLGVNLAGVEVILRMAHRLSDLQRELEAKEEEIRRLRGESQ